MLDFVFEYNYRVLVTLNVHEIQGAGNPEKSLFIYGTQTRIAHPLERKSDDRESVLYLTSCINMQNIRAHLKVFSFSEMDCRWQYTITIYVLYF